ncbi:MULTISPECIES: hypothetical protein [unclassified Paenibacillus]|uniref:hypothetical protein n=1 Tax=unclassified Paenibacillus TaxID=185978 RepID=UPI000930580B|nr:MULTISPECIES: hypothetical protein [unclassified Paenibacillus]
MRAEQLARLAVRGAERNKPVVCPPALRRTMMEACFILLRGVHRRWVRFIRDAARTASQNGVKQQ